MGTITGDLLGRLHALPLDESVRCRARPARGRPRLGAVGCWDEDAPKPIVDAYRQHVELTVDELDRLHAAMAIRPLYLTCFGYRRGVLTGQEVEGFRPMTGVIWRDERTDAAIRDELDALHPERLKLRPTDVDGLREAFTVLEELWVPTIARARRLPPEKVHERVDGEYSFVETFRHLLFAWEAWLSRTVLPARDDFHPWGIPPDDGFASDAPMPVLWVRGTGWTTADAAPEFDAVLDLRADYFARVHGYLAKATTEDVNAPGAPAPWHQQDASVLYCLRVVLHDEWWHHQFATRDLAVLEQA